MYETQSSSIINIVAAANDIVPACSSLTLFLTKPVLSHSAGLVLDGTWTLLCQLYVGRVWLLKPRMILSKHGRVKMAQAIMAKMEK